MHHFIKFVCVQNQCNRLFHLLNSFKKYLVATHCSHTSKFTNNVIATSSLNNNELLSVYSWKSYVNTNTFSSGMLHIQALSTDNYINLKWPARLLRKQIDQFLASLYFNYQIPHNVQKA